MFKKLLIPSAENKYSPALSSKTALIIFMLWLLVFNGAASILIDNHEAYASTLSSNRIIQLANEERRQRGLGTVQVNALLTSAAYTKANNMFQEQYWDHFGPNGETPWQFIKAAGYEYAYAGENLGKGFNTSEALHQAWMASTTHRDNILNENYTDIGIAIVHGNLQNQNVVLVVQFFASPADNSVILGNAEYEQGESLNGDLKSIRIVYPEDGAVYNDATIPIKGEINNLEDSKTIEIIAENSVLGTTEIKNDNTWEFQNAYDWKQGVNDIDAVVNDGQDTLLSSVMFMIDSIPPSLLDLNVKSVNDTYELVLEIDKIPSKASLISGENIITVEVIGSQTQLSIPKKDIRNKIFLVLSDESGNVSESEITDYFPEEQAETGSGLAFFMNAPNAQRTIIILFGLFVLCVLIIQLYHYKKLGMLREREGDFLMVGLWWLILLFGVFIGYAGSVT